ncbi:flagellar hook-length control protein FliK [uncultured Halopseudomonas sp.]|uniref:flagellar hook-length control protein FliK n=1 Tax=uncultured Halopseudomonas sp. TaxID=2901193 RepID=UPI0030EDA439|tara:strand:+ start:12952 stop:14385 length:1434 start_codon:yes stop_codon:yes gene_type:complete
MSVSQNLLAFFSGGSPQVSSSVTPASTTENTKIEGLANFAEILMDQQPDDVEALMQLLGDAEGEQTQGLLDLAEIAADGKNLPAGMQEWLAQLDELRSETEDQAASLQTGETSEEQQLELGALVEDWSQWLDQARQFMGKAQDTEVTASEPVDADAADALATMAELVGTQLASKAVEAANTVLEAPGAVKTAPAIASAATSAEPLLDPVRKLRRDAGATGLQLSQEQTSRAERDMRQEPAGNNGLRAMAERGVSADGQQPVQRNLDMTPAAAEGRAAFAGKLAETLEALGGRTAKSDPDSAEAMLRPGTQTQAAAQGALAARPVLAASQTLNVPFGQAGWGDAVMDKMMWMSSQNLRSVEIRLDPADLGPLEIHIQTRGQEHQVQFVTQNPSVREALEAQMFRLREAFNQQGMDLVNVSVGDSAVDQQAHHSEGGGSDGRGRGVVGTQTRESDEAGMMIASAALSQAETSRLVDYYA